MEKCRHVKIIDDDCGAGQNLWLRSDISISGLLDRMSVWPPLLITVIPVARWQYQNFPKYVLVNSTFYPCHFSNLNSEKKGILNLDHLWQGDRGEKRAKQLKYKPRLAHVKETPTQESIYRVYASSKNGKYIWHVNKPALTPQHNDDENSDCIRSFNYNGMATFKETEAVHF